MNKIQVCETFLKPITNSHSKALSQTVSDEFNDSLPLCQSVCENFYRVCGYEEELWRCNTGTALMNSPSNRNTKIDRNLLKKNEYLQNGKDPKIVCTPSIKGDASGRWKISKIIIVLWLWCLFL